MAKPPDPLESGSFSIRIYTERDEDGVASLSVRAWEPVFSSMRGVLGAVIFDRLYPGGIADQDAAVRNVCNDHLDTTWVAESSGIPMGFVVVHLRPDSVVGEVWMLAVDPPYQRRGVGRALTDHAVARIRDAGKTMVQIGTGADEGHAPARPTYESAGFTSVPIAHYFKAL